MTNVWPVMMTGYYTMVSIWFVPSATVGNKDITTMYPQFKCNGCKRDTEFLWLEQLETPEGFKAYQCMECGCTGVKNVVEALHIPDSDICRCDKCGSWKFETVVCHTCQLIGAK